ncbi:MAG: glycosyltransferase family 39 protein [bacterium]|nr:glycosyltransferase family 39 protein [bacterium]
MSTTALKIPTEQLPLWMRQARRGVDWGVILVMMLGLFAALPFLIQDGLPRTNASENYAFLVHDYAEALREGRLYPRWSAHVLQGFGAPIPHFFPPGAPYSAALLEVLFTNNTINAVRLLFALSLMLAGATMYVLVTRLVNGRAGVLASVLYVYSPYIGHVSPYILGDLPGVVAFALLPALLWSVHRLRVLHSRYDFGLVAFIGGGLLLTDPRIYSAGAALSLLLLIALRTAPQPRRTARVILALGISTALTAFYWLPALVERDMVYWHPAAVQPQIPLVSLPDLVLPLRRIDLVELLPSPQWTIGLPLALSIPVSVVALFLAKRLASPQMLFLLAGITLGVVSVVFLPEQTWLVGVITFCLCIGGSGCLSLAVLDRAASQRLYLPVFLLVTLALALPVWSAPVWSPDFGDLNPLAQISYEQNDFGIAPLPPAFSLPSPFSAVVEADRFVITGYQDNSLNRVLPDQSQAGRRISILASRTHSDRLQIRTTSATSLLIARAYVPGWQAALDGDPLPVERDSLTGLLRVQIPAGANGQVVIAFGTTPIRQAAWLLSIGTLLLICLHGLRRSTAAFQYEDLSILNVEEARLIFLVIAGFSGILVLFTLPISPYSLQARPGYQLDNTIGMQNRTESGLELISYQLSTLHPNVGDTVELTLAWRTSRPLRDSYQVVVQVQDVEQGARWYETAPTIPAGYSTRRWQTNRYVRSIHSLRLSTLISGNYEVVIEVYNCRPECTPENRLSFFSSDGQFIGQALTLPTVLSVSN